MIKRYHDQDLGSSLILTDDHREIWGSHEGDFFKILWNRSNHFNLDLNGLNVTLDPNSLICLTPLQELEIQEPEGQYYLLLFNREFYCIHENDNEVSCEGLLFWGSSELPVLSLDEQELLKFVTLFQVFLDELNTRDKIQGEMLRMLLKRLIIKSTRLAKEIAYNLGFEEPAHFSRFFKKETGMSPSAYRKSFRKL